jgi:hypothetical protein
MHSEWQLVIGQYEYVNFCVATGCHTWVCHLFILYCCALFLATFNDMHTARTQIAH